MRILNYGAGAVGLGIDSCLLKAGVKVDIVARQNTVQALKASGLLRTGIFGDFHAPAKSFSAYASLDELPGAPYDFILVATKAFDSQSAAEDIARHPQIWNSKTKIILCQNGWGNAEIFANLLPKDQIYNARVITGFTRPKPNEVIITVHADAVHIGSLFHSKLDALKPLCQAITRGDLPCIPTQEIAKDLWAKMLYNCLLNPLGALLDVPYGALAEYETSRQIMKNMADEILAVMKKTGYQTHWDTSEEYLKLFYEKLVPATAEHRSSTLQSIKAKKKTEVDALIGIVVKLAEKHHVDVPTNRTIYQMIKFVEEKNKKSTAE